MKAIKIWIVIGIVFNPIVLGGILTMSGLRDYRVLYVFLLYLLSIPLGIYIYRSLNKAKNKSELNSKGILCLFFVSLIGGILILCLEDANKIDIREAEGFINSNKIQNDDFKNYVKEHKKKFKIFIDSLLSINNLEELNLSLSTLSECESLYIKGSCYMFGVYFDQNYSKSLECLLRSSDLGSGEASYGTSMIYHYGLNGNANLNLYRKYLNISINQGCLEAQEEWDLFFKNFKFKSKSKDNVLFEKISETLDVYNDIEILEYIDSTVDEIINSNFPKNKIDELLDSLKTSFQDNIKLIGLEDNVAKRKCKIIGLVNLKGFLNPTYKNNQNCIDIWYKYFDEKFTGPLILKKDAKNVNVENIKFKKDLFENLSFKEKSKSTKRNNSNKNR